jgi:hypothetical protein
MATITTLDRSTVRKLQAEAEAALAAVAAKYGMLLKQGNGRFSNDRLAVKFEFAVAAEAPKGKTGAGTGAPADFSRKARMVGLPEDCFGKTFRIGGTVYTIDEINLRRPKYPVSGTGPQGGRYKFTVDQVKFGLIG